VPHHGTLIGREPFQAVHSMGRRSAVTMTTAARWPASLMALGLLLAGCGGSSAKSAAPATPATGSSANSVTASSTSPAPGFASTSAGTPKGQLSKPDFLIEMNTLCAAYDARLEALPTPTAATDFAAISVSVAATLRLEPEFLARAEALTARTAERAVLEKNWLAVDKADLAAAKPLAQQLVAHSEAHDAAKVRADSGALDALPDHSARLVSFLNGYGLSKCARLESN
jgi:pimeloyl-ACP methyl ester carboxylesterase